MQNELISEKEILECISKSSYNKYMAAGTWPKPVSEQKVKQRKVRMYNRQEVMDIIDRISTNRGNPFGRKVRNSFSVGWRDLQYPVDFREFEPKEVDPWNSFR